MGHEGVRYTACLEWDDTLSHSSYDAPPDWSPRQIHQALKDMGFRPYTGFPLSSVRVSLLQVPPLTLIRAGLENIGCVSILSPGPSEYFLPDADKEQTAEALEAAGFAFAYEGLLAESPS